MGAGGPLCVERRRSVVRFAVMHPRRSPPSHARSRRGVAARPRSAALVALVVILGVACGAEPSPPALSAPPPTASTPEPVSSAHAEPAQPPPPASSVAATPPILTTSASAPPPPTPPEDPRNAWSDPPPGAKRVVSARGTKVGTTFLAGPCVIPHLDAAARRKTDPQFLSGEPANLDLDGDGVSDWRIFIDATNMTRTEALYVRRGPCGHFVGFLVSTANLAVVPGPAGAMRDLEGVTACQVECCSHATRDTWSFVGTEYRQVKTVPLNPDCSKARRRRGP